MKISTLYKLKFRRRRSGQTDHRKRLDLLKSRQPRLVVRKSLNAIRVQLVNYSPKGDLVNTTAFSHELKSAGWTYSKDSVPAAYLTGLLAGIRGKTAGLKEAVLDIGIYPPVKGSRLYAALKGAIDGGIKISANPEIFPKEERIKGAHIAAYASKLKKESPVLYQKKFSAYLKQNADPEKISAVFEHVKQKILKGEVQKKVKKQHA